LFVCLFVCLFVFFSSSSFLCVYNLYDFHNKINKNSAIEQDSHISHYQWWEQDKGKTKTKTEAQALGLKTKTETKTVCLFVCLFVRSITQHEGWLSPTERASVSAISLKPRSYRARRRASHAFGYVKSLKPSLKSLKSKATCCAATCCLLPNCCADEHVEGNKQLVARNTLLVRATFSYHLLGVLPLEFWEKVWTSEN